ncbi:MAG: acetoacetate--CoA ligase, partial [Acidimicrobiales bacterium]
MARTDTPSADPLWTPSPEYQARSRLGRWRAELVASGVLAPDAAYEDLWAWSVRRPEDFWIAAGAHLGVRWDRPPTPGAPVILPRHPESIEGTQWFARTRLSYARHALDPPGVAPGDLAVVGRSDTRSPAEHTFADLRDLVGRVQAGLVAAGVEPGDRVAGYLPNIPETLAVFLAAASLGAVWTCCAPEMGVPGVLDRLGAVEPRVLVSVDGYRYGDRDVPRTEEAGAIRAGLASVRTGVWLPYLDPAGAPPRGWVPWAELTAVAPTAAAGAVPDCEPVPWDHPLYILYSSGTTGRPKAIVHSHGGMVLEHLKALAFHFDLERGDRFFWFTTTGWMMWNFLVSGLLTGATVVLFDGHPTRPDPDALWALLAETATTCGGTGAAALVASHKAGARPGRDHDLSALRTLGSTGSPLPGATARWVYDAVKPDLLLNSFSGGTDVCTGFLGASPLQAVWAGEISGRCLGARVEVFDDAGRSVIGEEGELVLTEPLPSMPVGFWNDPDGARYHDAYFARFPGVWAHGDRLTLTDRGTCVISGRSDGTLNRGGVRMGTAEIYEVVEADDEVADSLAVHVEDPGGGPGELWLFVVTTSGALTDALRSRLTTALRRSLSPRHVPDRIVAVAAVPRTLSGKKLEVPAKRILAGVPVGEALTLAAVANPESIDAIAAHARSRHAAP